MVLEKGKKYKFEERKLWYKGKSWADRCEVWRKPHQSCNIEITNHAIKP